MDIKKNVRKIILAIHGFIFKQHYFEVVKLIEPNLFSYTKKGFGKMGDGRYILPGEMITNGDDEILLSFGISDDISFETEFHEAYPNVKIYAFDPTIQELPEKNSSINFLKIGLAGVSDFSRQLFSLEEIFKKCKFDYTKKYSLKIDIEGWEWDFFKKLNLKQFVIPIITIELHFLSLTTKRETLLLPFMFYQNLKILQKLKESFYIYHVHANNYQYINFNNFNFPAYVELTLVNKQFFLNDITNEIKSLHTPTLHDQPDHQFPFIRS